ncbi:hypothetical protein RhiTH_007841 [Rhizoctonia solani]|nr:hypothetical protein RHS04_01468 [Rhizoctonia solani]KAF8750639.1 hypothetical protein RHS01_08887 [Rhizoctonia solani]
MPDYTFPPAPSSDHLELRRPPSSPGQIPEPAPPIAHGSAYMDILNIQQARRSPPRPGSVSPPNRKGIRLPWSKDPRPQDGIASGLATTIGFGAAAAPGDVVENFKPVNDINWSPKK